MEIPILPNAHIRLLIRNRGKKVHAAKCLEQLLSSCVLQSYWREKWRITKFAFKARTARTPSLGMSSGQTTWRH